MNHPKKKLQEEEAIVISGPNIERARMLVICKGIELESKGMRRRGRSCTVIAKELYGLAGNRDRVLAQLRALIDSLTIVCEVDTEADIDES